MKRIVSLILCLCLGLALGVPALAGSETTEAELARITSLVQETLEIDDDYSFFSGEWDDNLNPGWHLRWRSSDGEWDLIVDCDEDGVVTDMFIFWTLEYLNPSSERPDAAVPALSETDARTEAERCLARLMGVGETAVMDSVAPTLQEDGGYRFAGMICKNGLPSPIRFQMTVGADGLSSYRRSDSYLGYVGVLPTAAVTEKDAAAALAAAMDFELCYVERDGEARLCYVQPYTVVDATSGETVNMDALYASLYVPGSNFFEVRLPAGVKKALPDADVIRELTPMELSIGRYLGIRSQDALDESVRALPGVDLTDFTVDWCSYGLDGDGNVIATLRYSCPMDKEHLFGFSQAACEDAISRDGELTVYKFCTLRAKTGELLSLQTSYPIEGKAREAAAMPFERMTEDFLAAAAPSLFPETALCRLSGVSFGEGETYARRHDGYFFPENYLYVHTDPGTGAIDEYRRVWDENVRFADAGGIVDEAAARDAYLNAVTLTKGYVAWPVALDAGDPILSCYADEGYSFAESLRLAWFYCGAEDVTGVDALTGDMITESEDGQLA